MTIRVLVTDDDPLVRSGLVMILGGAEDIEVVGQVADGAEAVRHVREHEVDVVLMDIRMPVMDGITATAAIVGRPAPPKVIVLTTFDGDDFVLRALAAGAGGFLLKDTDPAGIVSAVRRVHAGEPMLSPAVTEQLIRQVTDADSSGRSQRAKTAVAQLSERELEVAAAIGRGASNAEIAAELFMSVATVKAHLTRIFVKLDATNRVQVAIRMSEAGLL